MSQLAKLQQIVDNYVIQLEAQKKLTYRNNHERLAQMERDSALLKIIEDSAYPKCPHCGQKLPNV